MTNGGYEVLSICWMERTARFVTRLCKEGCRPTTGYGNTKCIKTSCNIISYKNITSYFIFLALWFLHLLRYFLEIMSTNTHISTPFSKSEVHIFQQIICHNLHLYKLNVVLLRNITLFFKTSISALGPSQPLFPLVSSSHSAEVKRPGHESEHSFLSTTEV